MNDALSPSVHEFLFGDGHSTYQGLLPSVRQAALPPSTMTRQRRRAEARAAAKR